MMTEINEDQPRRLDGYIRVSRVAGREGPSYISPAIQREAIERWAEYKEVTIAKWHVDEDATGGTHDRPGLDDAVQRCLAGETSGIVSWKIDRFSRSTEEGLRDLRRLKKVGARLVFTQEEVDTSGPMGEFVYTIMLAMAKYFLDQIKLSWTTSKTRAINRGAPINRAQIGYIKADTGKLTSDPASAPAMTEGFDILGRDGAAAALAFVRERIPDRTWTIFTLRRTFSNRVYLGEVIYGDLVCEDAHEPLVTRVVFERAQHALAEHVSYKRSRAGAFPLSGIATCGTCGAHLVGGRGGTEAERRYRCSAKHPKSPTIGADAMEAHVVDVLRAAFKHPGFEVGETDSTDLEREAVARLEEAEREFDAIATDATARRILKDRYHATLQAHADAVDHARAQLRAVQAEIVPTHVVLPDEVWDTLEPDELETVLRGALDTVILRPGRAPISERVTVVPKGTNRS